MFKRLQNKWKVNSLQLVLIICTFAIGGSTTGFIAKKIMNALPINQDWIWVTLYLLLMTIIWPIAIILVSIPFGQFPFFIKYIRKIGNKMGIGVPLPSKMNPKRVAIFASGSGSNAEKIIAYFDSHPTVSIQLIVTNNFKAGVLEIARKNKIPTLLIDKNSFFTPDSCINELKMAKIDFIILAGFLWKIPDSLIKNYPQKIINIHPALLPNYGGKGMYGHFVHEAVIDNREKESGITIHYVDEVYDHGKVIFQASCPVWENDTPATLANRIQGLEHEHYPVIIEQVLRN